MKLLASLLLLMGWAAAAQPLPIHHRPPSSSGNTLLGGLVASWNFDEQFIGVTNRFSNFGGFVWTNAGNIGGQRGVMGGAASVTNTTAYLTLTNAGVFALNSSFSMSAWVTGGGGGNGFIGQGTSVSSFDYEINQFGAVQFTTVDAGNSQHSASAGVLGNGTWYFIACGYDAANNQIWISLNGGAKTTASAGGSVRQTANMPFRMAYLMAGVDAFNFWNRVLTTAEITSLYNSGYGLQYPFTQSDPGTLIASAWSWTVTNDGGYASPANVSAIATFANGLITDGIWSKFNFILPVCPGTLQSALVPLKTPWKVAPGNDICSPMFDPYSTKVGYTSGDITVMGLKGETTAANATKYAEFRANNVIAYAPEIWPSINDASWSIYAAQAGLEASGFLFGIYDNGTAGSPGAGFRVNSFGVGPHAFLGDEGTSGDTNVAIAGYYSMNRASSTDAKLFIGSTTLTHGLYGGTNYANASATFRGIPAVIGALEITTAGIYYGSSNAISYLSTGTHLTQTESSNQFVRVSTMRSSFGGGIASPFTTQPTNSVVLIGNNKTLIGVSGGSPSAYQWKKNGSDIAGATTTSYAITGAALSDFGTYQLFATVGGIACPSDSIQLATVTTTTVSNWVVQVAVNGAALLSSNTIWGVDQFWNGMVTDSLSSKIIALNPLVPDSFLAASTPLIAGAGNKLWVNHNFVDGDISVNGLTGNTTTKYLDTGINLSTAPSSQQNQGFAVYLYTANLASTTEFDCGAGGAGNTSYFVIYSGSAIGSCGQNGPSYNQAGGVAPPGSGTGFYLDNRVSSTDHRLYFGNSGNAFAQLGSTDSLSFSGTLANLSYYFSAVNNGGGTPQLWTANTHSFWELHQNFSGSDMGNMYSRVQTLRTTLGGGYR